MESTTPPAQSGSSNAANPVTSPLQDPPRTVRSAQILDVTNEKVYFNLLPTELTKLAIERGEGAISKMGALTIKTGEYTGRSPNDRFIVETADIKDKVNWGKVNVGISEANYDKLYGKITKSLSAKKELFVCDGFAGADPESRIKVRVINNTATRNLFIYNLMIRPTEEELKTFQPDLTIMVDTECKADPNTDGTNSEAFVVLNFSKKTILIGTTGYCGEIKKSIFTYMNYYLPEKDELPMHCSANQGKGGDTALFFGLSGTGKTTLSTDPNRFLIGDDEHGWNANGIFNFEGGSYAKCINLDPKAEPLIYNAIKEGSVVENVVMDPETKEYDFADASLAENSRVGFPIEHIPGAITSGMGQHPRTIIFLTADAFGVLPPVARLSCEGAMYHFMSGYTSKLAGTERGIKEPQAAFSSFFGEPFMPQKPVVYADLLKKYITTFGCNVFLINTGWCGGPYGIGKRISIKDTRAIVTATLNGKIDGVSYRIDDVFNLAVPETCPDVDDKILSPRNTWQDKDAYDKQAQQLAQMFKDNFANFKDIPQDIKDAGPK
ncbi:phosphoenolpyruvate carboxykinase (ATP) [Patescibacteria group bacterium]|nr:phosphoenolpyruvate carboxykinase (ATP) [Patescibacteria group bacterium]